MPSRKEIKEELAEEAMELTRVEEDTMSLEALRGAALDAKQTEALRQFEQIAIRVGRVQAANLMSRFANSLHVSQLRALKALSKEAGYTWKRACQMVGMSTKMADQYLRLGDALGDDFVADSRRLGVSVRALEEARQLPEEDREALAAGEIVDLSQASKEQLTEAIHTLAQGHAKREAETQAALQKETKAKTRAETKLDKTATELEQTQAELEAQRLGLPADDAEALAAIRKEERNIIPHLVRIKNTLEFSGRDPQFAARVVNHCQLIAELAQATANVIACRAAGDEYDDEALLSGAEALNQEAAKFDKRGAFGL
ncbi:MAG: hypothetical protein PVG60_01835 [Desulfarculaceae bacterium]|jgi:hypothetical protein